MYKEIPNGTCIEIPDNAFGFIYKCWIPPVGYGVNVMTGEIEKTDIIKRSDTPSEQYWERQLLEKDYKSKRKIEKEKQTFNSKYIDPYLEAIRIREWNRRLRGVWFWNNGQLVYITGLQYLYINYWIFQGRYNDYRRPDRDSFYVIQYGIEDPFCLGINEIMNRKNGKSARATCLLYERTSRLEFHHGGIQSKTDKDAYELFKKGVVHPWKKLPDFFRPTYDLMKGDDPNDELRFFLTSKRGAQAEAEDFTEALDSFIDFKPSGESAYDGPELHTYVSDETSKTGRKVSIKERQNVTRYCSELNGEFKGFHLYTTTVEIEEDEEDNPEFVELTAMSNPLKRNANGRTITGLYTFFRPAHHSLFFDKYGEPDVERATVYLMNTRQQLQEEGKLRELSSFKRKQPMNFREAFSIDGAKSLYNPELLNNQYERIMFRTDLTEMGDLEWINGDRFWTMKEKEFGGYERVLNGLRFIPNPKGKFERIKGFEPVEPNKVYEMGGQFYPNNFEIFVIGADTFKFDKTKDKRRSNSAAFGYKIADATNPDIFDDYFPIRYLYRAESTREQHDDILKLAWYLGAKVLFERNVYEWKNDFIDSECGNFLMWIPGEVEPGIYTDGQGKTIQSLCSKTNAYINEHIHKVLFKSLIDKEAGWLGFKVDDTQKFDEPMAAGITLIAASLMKTSSHQNKLIDIEEYFRMYKTG